MYGLMGYKMCAVLSCFPYIYLEGC